MGRGKRLDSTVQCGVDKEAEVEEMWDWARFW